MKNGFFILILILFFTHEASSKTPVKAVAKAAPTRAQTKPQAVQAKPQVAVKGTKSRSVASDPDAPIEVRGQSRNLNMMLILQNQDEIIDFIKLRKDYQSETKKMNY